MPTKLLPALIALVPLLCLSIVLQGQYFSHKIKLTDPYQVHILKTLRGDRFVGNIVSIQSTQLQFKLSNENLLDFSFQEILWVITWGEDEQALSVNLPKLLSQKNKPIFAAPLHIGAENIIYSSSAFNYSRGHGEVKSYAFVINYADIGVTDDFSIGGGFVLPSIGLLRFKTTISADETAHFGLGANLVFPISDLADLVGVGHLYAVGSIGSKSRFFNITAGFFFPFDGFSELIFVTTVGGVYQISNQWRMHFELLYEDEELSFIPAYGVIWQKGKFKLELGMAAFPGLELDAPILPIIGLGFIF